jgi:NADH-quinone oxidoreductase subunit N
MLYGMSLVYGMTGTTKLDAIRHSIASNAGEPLIALSVLFVIAGFAFKISAVPFHFWAPDTYEGAPSPVAAFLSTASKIGGFVGLLVLMFRAFPEVADDWRPAFAALAVLTMTVGNLIALRQRHIIRLLAYSGIAQSGYILVAFALIDPSNPQVNAQAFEAAIVYLSIYALMDLGAFAAAVAYADRGGTYFIEDYAGLWNRNPGLALMMAGFLLSLAGAPPMAGVWAKVFIFFAAVNAQVYWLAAAVAINAVIAAFYYLAVVKRMFMDRPVVAEPFEIPGALRLAMGVAALALVVGCFYPGFLTTLTDGSIL